MSGEGAPALGRVDGASALRVVVIASLWHRDVMDGLVAGAERALTDSDVSARVLLRIPGAFELPVAAARVAAAGEVDAMVALGVVIRGGTPHFDYVCQAATSGLTSVAERTGLPIGFGLLTCDDEKQALDRAGLPGSMEDKGYEACMAAMATAVALAAYPASR
jgi:6,7-dimethyl-8-ribityllumazine synthase